MSAFRPFLFPAMQIDTRHTDGTLVVRLVGDWTLEGSLPRVHDAVADVSSDSVTALAFDTSELGTWDSSLVTFLFEAVEYGRAHDLDVRTGTLPASLARLVSLSQAVPEQKTGAEEETPSLLAQLGQWALRMYDEALDIVTFTGRLVQSLAGLLTRRVRMRWRTLGVALQSSTSSALPIVTVISFLVGLILSFLGTVVLRRFGAEYFVSYLVSYGMLRELGALMTAIIMTGRTGAAFAAELGSMKIAEEIDALKTFGISPIDFLVTPRVVAIVCAMPLLTLYADAIGIIGGLTVAVAMLDLTVTQFMTGLLEPVVLADGLIGVIKAVVFGGIIGLAGCMRGMQTGDDASAVGTATTSAVVTGIILIVLANAIIDWAAAIL